MGSNTLFGLASFKRAGYKIGVVDHLENIPVDLVDWYVDKELVHHRGFQYYLDSCEYAWDALICWDEMSVEMAHIIAKEFNIPGPLMNTRHFRDKTEMRSLLSKDQFLLPKYYKIHSLDEAMEISRELEYPFILKPADYGGSSGVYLINNDTDLKNQFDSVILKSKSNTCLMEEYIDGPEFSVETITSQGVHYILGVTQKSITKPPYFIEISHIFPAILSKEDYQNIIKVTKRALDILQIQRGASHTEIKLTNSGPLIIEVAGRLGGDSIPKLIWLSTGLNPYFMELSAIIGEEILYDITYNHISTIKFFTKTKNNRVVWTGLQRKLRHPQFEKILVDKTFWYPNDTIPPALKSNGKRLGYCILKGSRDEITEALHTIEDY